MPTHPGDGRKARDAEIASRRGAGGSVQDVKCDLARTAWGRSGSPRPEGARHAGEVDALALDASLRQIVATVRSLGRRGRTVLLGECDAQADTSLGMPAASSRWSGGLHLLPSFSVASDRYASAVIQLLEDRPAAAVIPASDGSIAALLTYREAIEERSRLALAATSALKIANDKDETLALADRLGLCTPRRIDLSCEGDTDLIGPTIGYPAVLKPSRSWASARGPGRRVQCIVVVDAGEARRGAERLLAMGIPLTAQEWIPGRRESVSIFYAQQRVWAAFAQVEHRTVPVIGGIAVYRESIDMLGDVRSAATALVEELNLEGYSEVEFRRDASGRPVLMEINARLSASVELAARAGIDFPWLVWRWAAGLPLSASNSYRTGVRLRWLPGDLKWLWRNIRAPGRPESVSETEAVGAFVSSFLTPSYYDYLDRRDLRPALTDVTNGLRKLGRMSRRHARASGA